MRANIVQFSIFLFSSSSFSASAVDDRIKINYSSSGNENLRGNNGKEEGTKSTSPRKDEIDDIKIDFIIENITIPVTDPNGGDSQKQEKVQYFHCFPTSREEQQHRNTKIIPRTNISHQRRDIVLLHRSEEVWIDSGLFDLFCHHAFIVNSHKNNKKEDTNLQLSVTALDINSDRADLFPRAIAILQNESILVEKPMILISPSASGLAVVNLIEESMASVTPSMMKKAKASQLIHTWIAVACPSVLQTEPRTLEAIPSMNISVLAIHGSEDDMGRRSSERLQQYSNATMMVMEGCGHKCIMEHADEFVHDVFPFFTA